MAVLANHVAAALVLASAQCSAGARSYRAAPLRQGAPLQQKWPWYRSSQQLHSDLLELASSCAGAEATLTALSRVNSAEAAGEEVRLDVLRVRRPGNSAKVRAVLVFGEHARELITGEAALALAQALCGRGRRAGLADSVLAGVDFLLVPNANPIGRSQVEQGYYCKRTNEDGVDLNRNWSNEHRDTLKQAGDEMYPGPNGFSEPETQLLKELIDQEKPDIYISVHSGAYLLGMPYGYQDDKPQDEAAMLEVLKPISQKFCAGGCPYGNLAKLIHYENPGCDIDYVYGQLNTPYVFTWEIYVGEDYRGRFVEEARLQSGGTSLAQQGRRHLRVLGASAVEAQGPEAAEEVGACMDQFNPQTEEETAAVADNWSAAFLALCKEVAERRGTAGSASMHPALPWAADGPQARTAGAPQPSKEAEG